MLQLFNNHCERNEFKMKIIEIRKFYYKLLSRYNGGWYPTYMNNKR